MNPSLLNDLKITVVSPAAVAAQTAVDSDIIDMAGFEGVLFLAVLGDVTTGCVLGLVAQQNTINSASGIASVAGAITFTAGATDADSKVLALDLYRPRERYVRAELTRTTANAVVGAILAIQYGAAKRPLAQLAASVVASGTAVEPAEV